MKGINEEISTLRNAFLSRLLAATRDGAYVTTDRECAGGVDESGDRGCCGGGEGAAGWRGMCSTLQNTTQQPEVGGIDRAGDAAWSCLKRSWNRTQRGDANDTREIVVRLARACGRRRLELLGARSYAAWGLQDQMAKNPETALKFMEGLVAGGDGDGAAGGGGD